MLSKEKIRIRFSKLNSNLWFHFMFWNLALLFYVFIVGKNHIFKTYADALEINSPILLIAYLSVICSILFAFIDALFSDRIMRFFPIRLMVFFKSVFYFTSAFVIIIAAAAPSAEIYSSQSYRDIILELPATNINLLRFLTYFYLSCFLNSFFKGFLRKIGGGNTQRFMLGLMNKPQEEERIFMFLDLKNSTTIAEKIGHKKFSHLVQDVFNDMAIVDNYKAEIYNYMGDGAIISWTVKDGIKNGNCLKAFFAFNSVLKNRTRYYNRKYNLEPKFKAGAHVGKVMVLQIGQIRRDISYNGDTMNTAARIESQCNELRQQVLISGDLQYLLKENKNFRFKSVGEIQLKGKRKGVEIFAAKEKL